ncbi:hypothetical protein OCOJLMKI_3683 [Methylobacterium iners]|uniref:Uncharacterized protein n=1 Tax=Methylobacterium iners TaxID=418707 RepID=A0ABQ4S3X0_9HYPH|nr:hypothetical protein OCOJLMKI_3683 [Methylobacterium iners]
MRGSHDGHPLPGGEGWGEGRAPSGEFTPLTLSLSPLERGPAGHPRSRTEQTETGKGRLARAAQPFGARAPKIAVPTRTWVAPIWIAAG